MDAKTYLNTLFSVVDEINQSLLRAYARIYSVINGETLLEFGGGPAVFSLISGAVRFQEIHFSDYDQGCLAEVLSWKNNEEKSFNWDKCIEYSLYVEKNKELPKPVEVVERRKLIQSRISYLLTCDAFSDNLLLNSGYQRYTAVANNFCLDGITSDKGLWKSLNQKLMKLVSRNGWYVTSTLLNARSWSIDEKIYPAVFLKSEDIIDLFKNNGFSVEYLEVITSSSRESYDGFIIAFGQKILE